MRRLVLAAVGIALSLTGCGSAAQTARNPQPTPTRVYHAKIGAPITLSGADDASGTGRLKITVEVVRLIPTAVGRGAFDNPRKGERFAAVRFAFKNVGDTPYHDSPTFGAEVVDATGHSYDPTVATVSAGRGFPRVVSLRHDQSRSGLIVFAVPRTAEIVSVRYALNAGEADEIGEWRPASHPGH